MRQTPPGTTMSTTMKKYEVHLVHQSPSKPLNLCATRKPRDIRYNRERVTSRLFSSSWTHRRAVYEKPVYLRIIRVVHFPKCR